MDTNTQTLLRLIAKAEVVKNHADEAQRLEDIKEHNRVAMRNSSIFGETQIVMSIISEMGASA